MPRERRYFNDHIEVRGKAGAGATIAGHAATFNEPYRLRAWDEQVARGAFSKTISEASIAALWNHDPNSVLGRNKNGTLRLTEDDSGLYYEIDLPDTQLARDLYTLIERGDIYQSSFGFKVIKDSWDKDTEKRGAPLRTLREIRLFDVSPVTFPANEATDVDLKRAVRSLAEDLDYDLDALSEAAEKGELRTIITDQYEAKASEERAEVTVQPTEEPQPHSEVTAQPQRKKKLI